MGPLQAHTVAAWKPQFRFFWSQNETPGLKVDAHEPVWCPPGSSPVASSGWSEQSDYILRLGWEIQDGKGLLGPSRLGEVQKLARVPRPVRH